MPEFSTRRLGVAILAWMLLSSFFAQTNGAFLIVEPVVDHGDADGSQSLEGSTTYRIKLAGLGETDMLVAIYGLEETPLHISSSEGFFQSALNPSWSASGLNPAFFSAFPDLAYDSYVTIGVDGPASVSPVAGVVDPSIVESEEAPIQTFFTTEGQSELLVNSSVGSSVYVLPSTTNGLPDEDGNVLMFQLTTAGEISGTIPVQVLLDGDGEQARLWEFSFDGIGAFDGSAACINDSDGDGICDEQEVTGCTNQEACNFESAATELDDSCLFPDPGKDCEGNCLIDLNGDGICESLDDWANSLRLSIEPWVIHDVGALAGQTTYRGFLSEMQEGDFVSAMFGIAEEPLLIHTPDGIYNNALNAGPTAAGLSAALLTVAPEAQFDSFITIGLASPAIGEGPSFSDPEVLELDNEIATYFTSPNAESLAIDSETGSSIYTLSGTENAIADAQRQVLLFQLTTAGDLSGRIPIQVFQQGLGDRAATRVFEFEGVGVYTGQPSCSYLPGSDCDLTIYGCLDSDACNYNPNAEADDGSCLALDACGVCGGDGTTCVGCLDPNACNYDADALFDDGSCASLDVLGVCGGGCAFDNNGNGICDTDEPGSDGFCGEGTLWRDDLQQCVLEVPLYVPSASGTPTLNVCYFDFDKSGSVGLSDLLDMLSAFRKDCEE